MNDENLKHIEEIKIFFKSIDVEFIEPTPGNFVLNDGMLHIKYVDSFNHKMDYTKRFGIAGIAHDYFINISHENYKKGIRTIWIKDWEWIDQRKHNVLKSYIRTATGRIGTRYNARDTEVREIDTKIARPFMETHCFYGFRGANVSLGLFAKKTKGDISAGELLMIYTFGHPFFAAKKYDVEVIRVGTRIDTQVVGGASKLLKYFMDNHHYLNINGKLIPTNKLVFYVDADHNNGKSLETLGFQYVDWKGNGFMNVETSTGKVSHRQPMHHKKIMERMAKGEMYSVSNAGTIVYLLERETHIPEKSSVLDDNLFDE